VRESAATAVGGGGRSIFDTLLGASVFLWRRHVRRLRVDPGRRGGAGEVGDCVSGRRRSLSWVRGMLSPLGRSGFGGTAGCWG